jgi:vacuolar-type H+-ATPase subunit F/Vma7
MNKTEILVIGRNDDVLQSVTKLINSNLEWNGVDAGSDEDAIEKFHQRVFDIVLLTNDITEVEEKKLRKIFTHQNPDVIIIKHPDDEGGLLNTKIEDSLHKKNINKKTSFSFVDDPLPSITSNGKRETAKKNSQ